MLLIVARGSVEPLPSAWQRFGNDSSKTAQTESLPNSWQRFDLGNCFIICICRFGESLPSLKSVSKKNTYLEVFDVADL